VRGDLTRDRLGLEEQQQIVVTAGFRVGAAHIEAAEGLPADQRASALPIEVEVADEELVFGPLQPQLAPRVRRPGESELGSVGDRERVVGVARLDDRQLCPENLFLRDSRVGRDVGHHGRLDEVPVARRPLAAGQ